MRLIAIALTALTTLLVVATAGAVLDKRQDETTLAPGELGSATAKCERGSRAVSGGFNLRGVDAKGPSFPFSAGTFRGARRSWTSRAENSSSSPTPATLVSFAYCSRDLPPLTVEATSSDTVPYDTAEVLRARCPRGSEVVSGGFKAPGSGGNQVAIFESRRVGKRTWRVTASGTSKSETRAVALAYCANRDLGLDTRSASDSSNQDTTDVVAKARCREGQQAVSGGFELEGDLSGSAYVTVFRSFRAGGRGWKAVAANYSGTEPITWNAYAYCLGKSIG